MLTIKKITKSFNKKHVLAGVDFTIRKGEIIALVGNNGAGKTTLLRIISGLLNADSGEILCESAGKKLKIGVLIENPGLYTDMTAFDNIMAKALCIGYECSEEKVNDLLTSVGLENVGDKKVGKFSLGMKQRLGIALALIGEPDIVILDEPTNSLDPQGIIEIRQLFKKINQEFNTTLIVSSHVLDELVKYANKFLVLHKGKIIKEISREDLLKESNDTPIDEYYMSILNNYKE